MISAPQHLIILQTEDLCARFREYLEQEGSEGVCVAVDSEPERFQVQQLLARRQFDLVLIQESARWYPPSLLVEHVKETDTEGRSEVVCLAYVRDGRAMSQFIHEGGAGFVPFDLAGSDLREVFAQARETAEESRRNKEPKKDKVLRAIDRYSREVGFQRFALAMFEELYPEARLTHGPLEKGKDIICWELNRMGFREYVGVQIKLGDVNGSVKEDGAAELFLQVLEGLGLPDDVEEGMLYMDKFVVLVSGTINKAARGRLNEFVRRYRLDRRVFFMDRNNIAATVVQHCPRFFATLK